ncbi:MAG: glycine/sarcosine/betaine reductase selenoprotein B family protein [Dehalococcoidia bacterium]
MPRLSALSEVARNAQLTFPAQVNDDAPFTHPARPLAKATVAIVTTAGLHPRDARPFTGGDQTWRAIPDGISDLLQSHASIGFDRTPTQRDLNVVYPIDRLRELRDAGRIGAVAPYHYSFMGAQRDPARIMNETAPEVARRLLDAGADTVLLTPT